MCLKVADCTHFGMNSGEGGGGWWRDGTEEGKGESAELSAVAGRECGDSGTERRRQATGLSGVGFAAVGFVATMDPAVCSWLTQHDLAELVPVFTSKYCYVTSRMVVLFLCMSWCHLVSQHLADSRRTLVGAGVASNGCLAFRVACLSAFISVL